MGTVREANLEKGKLSKRKVTGSLLALKLLDQALSLKDFQKCEPINCLYDLRLFELRLFLVTKVTRTDTACINASLSTCTAVTSLSVGVVTSAQATLPP